MRSPQKKTANEIFDVPETVIKKPKFFRSVEYYYPSRHQDIGHAPQGRRQ